MRVIRTGMYFNRVDAETTNIKDDDYNVDFAWFNVGNANLSHLGFIKPMIPDAHNHVARFLDIVVQGSERRNFKRRISNGRIVNHAIVETIFTVVIERSPPEAVTFGSLLHGASSVTIGTVLGHEAAAGSYPLMFVTVPLGIIVVGSAIGVSKGLQAGLQKEVEKVIKRIFK